MKRLSLSTYERSLLKNVLMRVLENLYFDDKIGKFVESSEDWKLSMTPVTYRELVAICEKLITSTNENAVKTNAK